MKNEKELWIDKLMREATEVPTIINSRNVVLDKILDRIDKPEKKYSLVSFDQFKLAGVAAIAILALNIAVLTISKIQRAPNEDSKTAYGLSTYNLDLYQ